VKIRDASNALRTVKTIHVRDASNVSRVVKQIHVRDASNVSRLMAGTGSAGTTMTVIADPNTVYGATGSHAPQRVYTNGTTATPTGGTPPYSYAWTADSGWDATAATAATTAFLSPSVGPGDGGVFGNAFCTVTDSNGQVVASNDVSLNADNYGI
jgi:hypothetical protein